MISDSGNVDDVSAKQERDAVDPGMSVRSLTVVVALGAGAFGLLLGAWIGLSRSPIITTVLPLLFGVVGGAGGVQVFRFDPSSRINRDRLVLLGTCTASFSICCLAAMLIAIAAWPRFAVYFTVQTPHVDILKLTSDGPFKDRPLEALTLRRRLEAIGANAAEVTAVLGVAQVAAKMLPSDGDPVQDLDSLISELKDKQDQDKNLEPPAPVFVAPPSH